jgi:hypothetical protein
LLTQRLELIYLWYEGVVNPDKNPGKARYFLCLPRESILISHRHLLINRLTLLI